VISGSVTSGGVGSSTDLTGSSGSGMGGNPSGIFFGFGMMQSFRG
jgi:hypothetical protein